MIGSPSHGYDAVYPFSIIHYFTSAFRPQKCIDPLIILWGDNYTICNLPNGSIDACITCCSSIISWFCYKQHIYKWHIMGQSRLVCSWGTSWKWQNYTETALSTADCNFCILFHRDKCTTKEFLSTKKKLGSISTKVTVSYNWHN